MIKILIDAHVFDGKPQGTVTYLQGLYGELVKTSNDVHYCFAAQNCDNLKSVFGETPNISYIQLRSSNKYFRLIFELPFITWKYKIDYAHYLYISPLFKCCKEVLTICDLLFLDFPNYFPIKYRVINEWLFKRSAKRADHLVAISDYSREAIERHFRIQKEKTFITPLGFIPSMVNFSKEKEIELLEKFGLSKYLLYVSRFEPRKNHVGLLKAFVEMKLWEEDYKLVLIGVRDLSVPMFDKYYEGLDERIKSNVLLLHNVNNEELTMFYRNADLFVFPSFAEGFGIPPLEAYLNGAKVACSNQTAMSDFSFLSDGFFDPNNFDEMKAVIRFKLDNPNCADQQSLEEVAQIYSWKTITEDFGCYLFEHKDE